MTLNLFSRVDVTDAGALNFVAGNSKAGDYIELYAPMNTLVVLTAIQHPLDPNPEYAPKPVKLALSKARPRSRRTLPHVVRRKRARLHQHRSLLSLSGDAP